MTRLVAFLVAAIASIAVAFAQAPAKDAKKETPKAEAAKDTKAADTKKAEAKPAADAKKADGKADAKKAEPMDINSAPEKELATLPGIGEARAKAIVKGRPYKGKNELKDRKIIPENVYNDISEKIIAKQK
jgi:DNA uptake protein ComE-like DNA-binding protein